MFLAIKKYPLLFVFALFGAGFLSYLGYWQHQKGVQFEIDELSRLQNLNKQVINLNAQTKIPHLNDGSRVILSGHFVDDKIIFHDNKLNLGKVGYHVFSFFKLDDDRTVLVNRGWVAMNYDRRILPDVKTNDLRVTLKGVIRFPVKGVYTLAEQQVDSVFPQRLQTIDVDKLDIATGYHLEKYSVLLDKSVKGDHFYRHWDDLLPGKYMSADKHYAYSLQWYSLAFIGLIVFIILIMKMAKNEYE